VRDKRYRSTALGRVVSDYLTWKEIEDGAAARTLDQYERDLARLSPSPSFGAREAHSGRVPHRDRLLPTPLP
jgi:hypothetical protein